MIYSESDLVIPTLTLLAQNVESGLTTSEIIEKLMDGLEISEDDLRILSGRKDTHFHQKARNLLGSHIETNALGRLKLTIQVDVHRNTLHKITQHGLDYLAKNSDDFTFLVEGGFSEEERKYEIDRDFKDLIIEEGFITPFTPKEKRSRSRKLTEIAKQRYRQGDRISCYACNFNFEDFYGTRGKDYIEIHHLKPIHTYSEADTSKTLNEALNNVKPVCSNCHRTIHRDAKKIINIDELTQLVLSNGKFDIKQAV